VSRTSKIVNPQSQMLKEENNLGVTTRVALSLLALFAKSKKELKQAVQSLTRAYSVVKDLTGFKNL